MTTQPKATTTHTCDQLGMCQSRTTACPTCNCHPDDCGGELCRFETPIERIAYWVSVGLATGLTVALVFASAGYLAAKLL